jgi:hypothetical protein
MKMTVPCVHTIFALTLATIVFAKQQLNQSLE